MNSQSSCAEVELKGGLDEIALPTYRYFPGWTMLGIAAMAQFLSAPGQSFSVAVFKDPMRMSLGLSETQYSLAYGFATIVSACLLPFIGRMLDHWGARIILPVVATGLAISCYFMSQIHTLGSLYLGFSLVRSLGQGALTLISVWMVGEWFEKKRGRTTALAGFGSAFSVMTVPFLNSWLISHYGWKTGWVFHAVTVAVCLILPGIFLVRNRPEDLGLHPDGIDPDQEPEPQPEEKSKRPLITATIESWTVRQVLRDPTFWKLLSVITTHALVGTGLVFHQIALLGSHGVPEYWAIRMMAFQALCATLLMFPAGWLTDRFPSRYILCFSMLCLALANLIVLTMPAIWMVVVYTFLLGTTGSIFRSTATVVWINYYGRMNQGAVRGVAWSMMILASALGPLPVAMSIDYFGSYNPVLYLFMALPLLAAFAVWSAHPPTLFKEEQPAVEPEAAS
ncbi:Major Facilitator Superfamily protein [Gimesia panareensis]|uniref:Major Facilitator Superfamily protein n=1 Tax=Gimesia panareensis TaxID=2527978 RepID=A0A517QAS3_9PLAN|nr:MFS transporter [Gimesia panareensis]QDT28722.1 Major Facilitator Superfamily protein [Gimesia panareensis]